MAARSGYVRSSASLRHDTGPGHPERADRVLAVERRLAEAGLLRELDLAEAVDADRTAIERVHDAAYVRAIEQAIARGARIVDTGDTRVSAGSWAAALAAAGGALLAADRVLDGAWKNAFVGVRPPGHHAERAEALGFCLLNNAAIAAAHLRARGVPRVAILDWDVHHGNGTQHLFERDPSVFYASLHQWPLYPGTGLASERGVGPGEGTTLNCPQPPRAGDREWLGSLEREILPALDAFAPDFVILSAGFDAHADDPLAQTRVSTEGFGAMSRLVLDLARQRCQGRLVAVLEGGYDLAALSDSVEAHVGALSAAS